ncbi:ATP-binding cassette domain-containing protein [Dongia mobilis]|uniref:phosphonate ABC transporter ATP-binding protein n=1 Tax=Dongia sp. TaxID=1977262 RepID=UPI0026E9E826
MTVVSVARAGKPRIAAAYAAAVRRPLDGVPARSATVAIELDISNLRKSYQATTTILDGVSLAVPGGQSVALIGSNGAGKSTLLRCCLRLIEPNGGSIHLLGEDVRALDHGALRRLRAQIGFVFQRHNLVGQLSVLSNVLHGAQARISGPRGWFHCMAPSALRDEAMHCLDLVGLADFAGRRADQLSGGQSQRVAIARTLMQRPRLMFADEPVASLDPSAGEEVMELFAELIRQQGLTLVFTSHHINHALRFADRVVALRGGRIDIDAMSASLDARDLRGVYE